MPANTRFPLTPGRCYAGAAMDTRAILTHPLLQRMLAAMLAPLLAVAGVLFVLRLLGMI